MVSLKTLSKIGAFALVIALLTVFLACSVNTPQTTYTSLEELQDKRIGYVLTGITERMGKEHFPNANRYTFNSPMDAIAALQAGHLDGAMVSYPTVFMVSKNIPELTWIEEPVETTGVGIGVKKGNTELLNQVNACIDELKADGTLDEMISRWYNFENANYTMPDISLPTTGKPLLVCVSLDFEPSCFLNANGDVVGLDVELAYRIAKYMNRPIKFVDTLAASRPFALESGKADIVAANFAIDPMYEYVEFSQPYFDLPFMMVVKKGK